MRWLSGDAPIPTSKVGGRTNIGAQYSPSPAPNHRNHFDVQEPPEKRTAKFHGSKSCGKRSACLGPARWAYRGPLCTHSVQDLTRPPPCASPRIVHRARERPAPMAHNVAERRPTVAPARGGGYDSTMIICGRGITRADIARRGFSGDSGKPERVRLGLKGGGQLAPTRALGSNRDGDCRWGRGYNEQTILMTTKAKRRHEGRHLPERLRHQSGDKGGSAATLTAAQAPPHSHIVPRRHELGRQTGEGDRPLSDPSAVGLFGRLGGGMSRRRCGGGAFEYGPPTLCENFRGSGGGEAAVPPSKKNFWVPSHRNCRKSDPRTLEGPGLQLVGRLSWMSPP